MCTGTFGVRVDFEFHFVAGRNLDPFLHIAHANIENILVEDLIAVLPLLRIRFLRLHHLLDFGLHFIWQLPEIAWLDPTVSPTSLQNGAEIKLIACLLATLLLTPLFVLRTDFLLPLIRQLRKWLLRFVVFTRTLALALTLAF